MDYLRVLKVPIHPTILLMIAVFTALMALCVSGGLYGLFACLFMQIWILKYCYVLVEHLADGAADPPVMDIDMLSPFESRPWVQLALLTFLGWLAWRVGGAGTAVVAALIVLWLPASIAILGFGESWYQALNPLTVLRVIKGLGASYLLLLGVLVAGGFLLPALANANLPRVVIIALSLYYQVTFFALVGSFMFLRRQRLGYEPSRSPERTAARAEAERIRLRARMVDEVFQQVRIGKHVDATAPLAQWLGNTDADEATRDSIEVIEQALRWDSPPALNTIGSTVIRHLLRFGRADAALKVFERLRGKCPTFTMDSAPDLRTLAEYAESVGRDELAASMRLETPVFHPPR